ncbi:MAG: glycosyltransferase [Clostridia bacterium]|nr:glycosyltransferase [Clostridia bacterium]
MGKLVSVIMGIYNCEEYLEEALNCIINQTYTNWEVIMCDDGSKDNTIGVAQKFVDKYPDKFRLLKNEQNMGLNFTLNKCLYEAKGDYIARMDGDDLCSPERFQKEIDVLENNPDIAIVSTDMEFFDENGVWGKTNVNPNPTKLNFIKATPFCHAPCMVRKEAYFSVEGYTVDKRLLRVEDYHLWAKMYANGYKGVNIQEPLYQMRDDRNAQNRRKFKYRINSMYAHFLATKMLNLPIYTYIFCFFPIIKGLVPPFIFNIIRRNKYTTKQS